MLPDWSDCLLDDPTGSLKPDLYLLGLPFLPSQNSMLWFLTLDWAILSLQECLCQLHFVSFEQPLFLVVYFLCSIFHPLPFWICLHGANCLLDLDCLLIAPASLAVQFFVLSCLDLCLDLDIHSPFPCFQAGCFFLRQTAVCLLELTWCGEFDPCPFSFHPSAGLICSSIQIHFWFFLKTNHSFKKTVLKNLENSNSFKKDRKRADQRMNFRDGLLSKKKI